MQVNTEVYGARSTWRRDEGGFSWYNANIPEDMQFKRGQYNRLIDYVNNNKMSFGQHIDYSICYAAHGEGMPLASVRTWYTPYESGQWKAYTYKRNKVTGWFFGHQLDSYNNNAFYIRNPKALLVDGVTNNYTKTDLWLPDGQNANYPEQQSKLIAPIVEFPTRGAYFGIEVCLYKASSASFYRRPLSDLRSGDWSEYIIVSAYGKLYTYANNDRDYQQTSGRCCVCPNETYEFTREDTQQKGLSFLKYCQFNGMSYSPLPIFGWVDGGAISEYFGGRNHAVKRMFWNGTDYQGYSVMFIDTVPNAVFNAFDDGYIEAYCTVTSENLEAIRKAAAAYGLFFTEQDPENLRTNVNRWTNSAMFCGVLDENGVGHGEYTQGAGNRDNPVYNMGSSQNSNYDPTTPPTPVDPNTYSLITGFNSLSGGASATQRYVLNDSNVRQLLTDLWTITHNIAGVDYEKFDYKILDSFLVTDPINSIVSLKRFPFDIPHTFSPSKTTVCLGKNQGTAQGYLTYNVFNSIQFSGVSIYPKFGKSFLDFAPYTEYELYIPFCGAVKLNAGEILDHTLSVRMNIDLITGVCVAYILADSLCIETLTGSVSSDMQISGIDAATADGAVQNAVINHISARTNKEVADLSPLSPSGLMSSVTNPFKVSGSRTEANTALSKADYDITHINTPIHSMGSAGGLSSWIQEFNCRLIIYYPEGDAIDSSGGVSQTSPKLADLSLYGHTTGFSCISSGAVSNYHGFTIGNIDTSSISGATEQERDMIKSLFARGVYLP